MIEMMSFELLGEKAEKKLIDKMSAWLKDIYFGWFSDIDNYHFTITNKNKALQIDNNLWDIHGNSPTYWLAFKKDVNTKNKVMTEMFDLDSNTHFKATRFTEAIYHDFIDSYVSSIFEHTNVTYIKGTDIQNVKTYFGSGAVTGNFGNGTVLLPVAIGGDLVKAICSEANQNSHKLNFAENLAPREGSIHEYKSKFDVIAGQAKISLRDFSKMEVGDIILLDTQIGSPFIVSFPSKVQLHAQLGNLVNKKAIQFIE